jgi:hypothetical protein
VPSCTTFGVDNDIPKDATVRWFDYWLKGVDNGVMNEPAVKLYVMLPSDQGSVGSGFWVSGGSFPLPGTQTTRCYLGGSHANSVAGGGTLALTPACGGFFPSVKQENVGQCSQAGHIKNFGNECRYLNATQFYTRFDRQFGRRK